MINFELFIEGYKADVASDLPALLTFSIDDVKDFAARSTTFSKTIVLPGTAKNNALLGNIFDFKTENTTFDNLPNVNSNFNAFIGADVLIFQNNIQCLKGTMRLLKILNNKGRYEYEVAVFGELSLFISSTAAHLLEDLDFSDYDHTYNETTIAASWDNASGGSGYYYPLIDYGTYSVNKHDWDFKTFRPALFVKEYIDKIFSTNNFTYVSTLFGTTRFKSLIVPHNQKTLTKQSSLLASARVTSSYEVIGTSVGEYFDALTFDSFSGTDFTIDGSNQQITFTGATAIYSAININIAGFYHAAGNVSIKLVKNGDVAHYTLLQTLVATPGDSHYSFSYTIPSEFISPSDYYTIYFDRGIPNVGEDFAVTVDTAEFDFSTISGTQPVNVNYGDIVELNYAIPKNIRQIDFIAGLIKLFNLYIWEDKFDERKLYIEPYPDFYDLNPSNAIDWSYKINRDTTITITPLSELSSRYYNFKYKDDSDYFNDLYKKRYNESYGSRIYDSNYQFGDSSNSLEILFSGTPLVGYGGEDKVYSTIFKKSGDTEEIIDSNIRILVAKKVTDVSSWDIKDDTTVLDSYTDYGYGGHLDDPDSPASDLNFGAPKELFFTLVSGDLSANQFNVYWSAYMAEITSQHSKLISASFRLNAMDIFNLDFSKLIYLDGSLFRLNKIEDYNATIEDECKAELLKVINTQY